AIACSLQFLVACRLAEAGTIRPPPRDMHYNASWSGRNALGMVLQQAVHEVRRHRKRRGRRFPKGSVAHARQQRDLNRTIAFVLSGNDLSSRSVLVLLALHEERRDADICQHLGDVPRAKFGIEPRLVPTAESDIDVRVPTCKPLPQVALRIGLARITDGG